MITFCYAFLICLVLLALVVTLFAYVKLRRLVNWRFSNAYTDADMAYFYDIISEDDSKNPIAFMRKHKTYKLYTALSSVILVCSVALAVISLGYNVSYNNALKPRLEKVEYCKSIITKLYCTHPNDFKDLWDNDLKYLIYDDISYKLNPNTVENLSQRHRLLSSEKTELEFKGWYANEENEILLWYKIISPTVVEVRQMHFLLDASNKIMQMHEYIEPEYSIEYIVGES